MSLQRIDLEAQREYAYHGCMEEERIIGSEYRIDLSVWADLSASALSDELADTVDYVALRIIVSEEMRQRPNCSKLWFIESPNEFFASTRT